MNERAVRDAFREAIVRYCNVANAAGSRATGRALTITVSTARPLSARTQEWIFELARAHARRMLAAARDPVLSFPEAAGLPEPGYRFVFHPPALPGPRATSGSTNPDPNPIPAPDPGTEPLVRPAPTGPIALLTLSYDADFVWPCRIGAATDWLALGRWTSRPAPRATAMRLPTYATWLPRGPLLLVRNQHGRFAFGRSGSRPQYEIRIDGVPLPPGGAVPARPEGSIVYACDRASTVLSYRVDWEGRHGR